MPGTRARFAIIFVTVLIDLIGFGIIIPILPYYAQRLRAGGLGLGALLGAFSGMQFLSTAFLGRTSDPVRPPPLSPPPILLHPPRHVLFAPPPSLPRPPF